MKSEIENPGKIWKARGWTFRLHWPTPVDWWLFWLYLRFWGLFGVVGVFYLWRGGMHAPTFGEFMRAYRVGSGTAERTLTTGALLSFAALVVALLTLISLFVDIQSPPKRRRRHRISHS
jgi:hypothetical protein